MFGVSIKENISNAPRLLRVPHVPQEEGNQTQKADRKYVTATNFPGPTTNLLSTRQMGTKATKDKGSLVILLHAPRGEQEQDPHWTLQWARLGGCKCSCALYIEPGRARTEGMLCLYNYYQWSRNERYFEPAALCLARVNVLFPGFVFVSIKAELLP